jgi:phosphatidylserine decarboxylase
MTEFVKYPHSPIAYEGWPIILFGLVLSLVSWFLSSRLESPDSNFLRSTLCTVATVGAVFTVFSLWFFRNPERTPESNDPKAIISGADGTVLKVETVNDPRYGEPSQKVSIFMSPLNVHVNRAPIAGTIEKVEYISGKFFAANLDKASTDNERNLVIIKNAQGQRVAFLQIAGFIARRIVCHVKAGDVLSVGQRYGLIRFGSRMEIFMPIGTQVLVKPGQVLQAGHTQIGKLPG